MSKFLHMKNTYIAGVALAVLLISVVTGGSFIRGQVAGQATTTPITIGATLCLTGACAEWGENSLKGLKLAAEHINAEGGILGRQVVLNVQDSAEDTPTNTLNAYQSLRAQGVDIVVGPTWSTAALALAPVARKDDVLVISPSVGSPFNEQGTNLFKVWPHDDLATRALAKTALAQGIRTVAIVGSKDSWYQLQADAFTEAFIDGGGRVVTRIDLLPGAKDVRSEAAKINVAAPEGVFYANYESVGLLAQELKVQGFRGEQYTVVIDAMNIEQARGALEGAYNMQYAKPPESFVTAYMATYGAEPGITADTAYDTLYLLKQEIERVGEVNVEKLVEGMRTLASYDGVSGAMTFDGMGSVIKPPVIYQVQNGKLSEVK
jgi:branched-chain amino acid transport system substrate-binding protein